MKVSRLGMAIALGLSIGLSAPASGAIILFAGADNGAGPGDARPNSNAAAAAFDASAPGSSIVTFEGASVGNFATMSVGTGVTVTLTNTVNAVCAGICNSGDIQLGYNTTVVGTNYLRVIPNLGDIAASITFNFAAAIDAFGFYYVGTEAGIDGTFAVQFNDGSSQSYSLTEMAAGGGVGFFGFADFGKLITSVTLLEIGPFVTRDIWGLDDVRVHTAAVPEPATMLILGLGLVGLGVARRRKS